MKQILSNLSNGVKKHQKIIAVLIGYFLVAGLFFSIGQVFSKNHSPEIKIEKPALDLTQIYNNSNTVPSQSVAGAATSTSPGSSTCQVKGNPTSKIYHVPGGTFYATLKNFTCFDTEKAAQDAGFRKSLR
jgi:hypothetical protein